MFVCLDREHRELVIIIRSKSIVRGKARGFQEIQLCFPRTPESFSL